MRAQGNVASALVASLALVVAVGIAQVVDADDDGDPPATIRVAGISQSAVDAEAEAAAEGAAAVTQRLNEPVGHHGEYAVQYGDLPAETRAELDIVRDIIERYPTVADAKADGWSAATTNLKGIASHFLRGGAVGFASGIDGTFEVANPEVLLFDGLEDGDPIVGVSYLHSGETPEGFTGQWDIWHRHDAVCFAGGLVTAEVGGHPDSKIAVEEQACRDQGGFIFPIANLSMIHVWMKPGFESSAGVFSHDHPELY